MNEVHCEMGERSWHGKFESRPEKKREKKKKKRAEERSDKNPNIPGKKFLVHTSLSCIIRNNLLDILECH